MKIFISRNILYLDKRLFEVFDLIVFCNLNLGKFKEVLRYYFKCYEYCLEYFLNFDYYYGLCLFNIVIIYFKLKDSENVLKFLKKLKINIFKNKRLIDSYYELMNLINKWIVMENIYIFLVIVVGVVVSVCLFLVKELLLKFKKVKGYEWDEGIIIILWGVIKFYLLIGVFFLFVVLIVVVFF